MGSKLSTAEQFEPFPFSVGLEWNFFYSISVSHGKHSSASCISSTAVPSEKLGSQFCRGICNQNAGDIAYYHIKLDTAESLQHSSRVMRFIRCCWSSIIRVGFFTPLSEGVNLWIEGNHCTEKYRKAVLKQASCKSSNQGSWRLLFVFWGYLDRQLQSTTTSLYMLYKHQTFPEAFTVSSLISSPVAI